MLHDNAFRFLAHVSGPTGDPEPLQRYLADSMVLPCSIIKGALAGLGLPATVSPETIQPPACVLCVRMQA